MPRVPAVEPVPPPDPSRMSAMELRAGYSLASLFGLRMLGLFLILPVFAVHAPRLAGGDNLTLVGIALGAYGLAQAILQLPFGMASDRFGRKPVIAFASDRFRPRKFPRRLCNRYLCRNRGPCAAGRGRNLVSRRRARRRPYA